MAVTCSLNGNNSRGEFDTITDFMMDVVGALLAGVANLGSARVKEF